MDKQQDNPPAGGQQQVQVKITDDILKGVYANMVQVGHTPEEFVLDFMNIVGTAGMVNARVIVSPGHFKRLIAAMQDNLKRYEEQFGKIKESQAPEHKIGFRTE
jgi:hypothetical protein